jgi:hypothetical protein
MTRLAITEPPTSVIPPEALAGRFAPTHHAVLFNLADYESKSPGGLAIRVLRQIGKRTDLIGTRSIREQEHRIYLPLWVQSHRIRTAVLADAQRLRPWVVRTALELMPALDQMLLVTEPGHHDSVLAALRSYGLDPERLDWDDFTTAHPRLPTPVAGSATYGMEHLPNVDFLLFRDRCRADNTPDRFTAIDTDYRHAFHLASTVAPDERSVLNLLTEHVRDAVTTAQILVAVRATQRALFARGHLMQVHPDRLLGTLTAIQPPRPLDRHWHALRAYIRPERSAVIALFLLGVPTGDIATLPIRAVTRALQTDDLDGQPVPDLAKPFLHAQLLRREREEAPPDDPFLMLRGRRHQEFLADARRDLDIPLDSRLITNDHKNHFNRALYRIGIQVRPLT